MRLYRLLLLQLFSVQANSSYSFDGTFVNELLYFDGVQVSYFFKAGALFPKGLKYISTYNNIKNTVSPYYFVGGALSYYVNNFFVANFDLNKVSLYVGGMKLKNSQAYNIKLIFDFSSFFIGINLISSNFLKSKDKLSHYGIIFGTTINSDLSVYNVLIAGSLYKFNIDDTNKSFNMNHCLNVDRFNDLGLEQNKIQAKAIERANNQTYLTCLMEETDSVVYNAMQDYNKKVLCEIRKLIMDCKEAFWIYRRDNPNQSTIVEKLIAKHTSKDSNFFNVYNELLSVNKPNHTVLENQVIEIIKKVYELNFDQNVENNYNNLNFHEKDISIFLLKDEDAELNALKDFLRLIVNFITKLNKIKNKSKIKTKSH